MANKVQPEEEAPTPVEAPKQTYFFPELGLSVEASSREEAEKLAETKQNG